MVYTRRKQAAQCFNSKKYERVTVHNNCECTQRDYECDAAFEPASEGSRSCVPSADAAPQYANDPDIQHPNQFVLDMLKLHHNADLVPTMCAKYREQGQLLALTGYRRIPGDSCTGGLNLEPIMYQCSSEVAVGQMLIGLICLGMVVLFGYISHQSGWCADSVAGMSFVTRSGPGAKYAIVQDDFNGPSTLFDADLELEPDEAVDMSQEDIDPILAELEQELLVV